MDGKGEPDPDDVMMHHNYPSPTADNSDVAQYYQPPPREQELDQQLVSDQQGDGQEQQQAGHDQQTTPRRHQTRPSVSAEELQLAAQLTQGLAPIMAAHSQAHDGQLQAQEADMQGAQDPAAAFDDHQAAHTDPNLHDHLQNQHLQSQLQNHHDHHDLQNVLPHVDQPPHYASPPPPAPGAQGHLPPQLPLDHMGQTYHGLSDSIPPRKRSKVSRACDECRRKKIKCDAASEGGDEPCSNCRRSCSRCLFSRIPQKRGPSKGYIKELADRINSIEGKLGSGDVLDGSPARAEAFSQLPPDESRKRPFSNITTDPFSTSTPARQTEWSADQRYIQPYQSPAFRAPFHANGLAPRPLGPPGDASSNVDLAHVDASQLDQLRVIDESSFDLYLQTLHQTFPLLASDRNRVHALLALSPPSLRDAFLEIFYAALPSPKETPPEQRGSARTANRLLTDWEAESEMRTTATDLVHLQTLILIALEADSHGPASVKALDGGPPKTSVLGRAIGLAYSMGLHRITVDSNPELESDADAEDKVAVRAWWSLVVLDRWNAMGAATPTMISNDSVVILPSLKPILGESCYTFLHLSTLVGHFVPLSLSPPRDPGPGGPVIGSWMNLAVEGFRLNLPPTITPATHPLIHLAYWHCRLLSYLFSPAALSSDILWSAKNLVELLTGHPQLATPLNHHFTSLAALSLLELARVDKTRDEAARLARELVETAIAPSAWDDAVRDKISDRLRPSTSSGGVDSHGLQHLADLATATTNNNATTNNAAPDKSEEPVVYRTADNYENAGFDPRPILQAGYLNAFTPPEASHQPVS